MRQKSFETEVPGGRLYLVPTPIGNMEDMTFRGVRLLKEVDTILAEDTRQTMKLLQAYEIETPLTSFHEHTATQKLMDLVKRIEAGEQMALVSDAGMPLINDPGHPLVQALLERDVPVIALPGANAALTALIASGLPSDRFTYYGFFPRQKKDRTLVLQEVGERQETALFYESPYRVLEMLKAVEQILGSQTRVVIARELTKRYEEYIRGSVTEVLAIVQDQPLKGECVVLIEGGLLMEAASSQQDKLSYKEHVELLMAQTGLTSKEAIKEVAKIRKEKKQTVYRAYHELDE